MTDTGDILGALRQIDDNVRNLHGDVKVALDRTIYHSEKIRNLEDGLGKQGLDIARAKGQAAAIAIGGSGIFAVLLEWGKSIFGGHHP
jgi:hypothetical protein